MKKQLKMYASLLVLMLFLALPSVRSQAAEGPLKYMSKVVYCPDSGTMNAYLELHYEYKIGDRITYKNLTPGNLAFVDQKFDNCPVLNFWKLKDKDGKIQVILQRGKTKYSKTFVIKWYDYPILKKMTIGGVNYQPFLKHVDLFFNAAGYLKGKVQVKAPAGWEVSDEMICLTEGKNGKRESALLKLSQKLPDKCTGVYIYLNNKKNPDIRQMFGIQSPWRPTEETELQF